MSSYKIYYNPNCSKSRKTLELLKENNIDPEIRLYLENPLTKDELLKITEILQVKPIEICRTKETLFQELGLEKTSSDKEILDAISENSSLLERPIVIKDEKSGVMGRPPENILRLI